MNHFLYAFFFLLVSTQSSTDGPRLNTTHTDLQEIEEKEFYGYFEGSGQEKMEGKVILNLKKIEINSQVFTKGHLNLMKSFIPSVFSVDFYGFQTNNTLEMFSDKRMAYKKLDPENRIGAMYFYGFHLPQKFPRPNSKLFCDYSLDVKLDDQNAIYKGDKDILLTGNISALGSCKNDAPIHITASNQIFKHFQTSSSRYIILTVVVNLMQLTLMVRQIKHSNTTARAAKMCIYTFMVIGVYDSFIIMMHVFVSLVYPSLFAPTSIAIITQFMIFSVFDMKFGVMIITANLENEERNGIDEMRKQLGHLYIKFCVILMVSTMVIYANMVDMFSILFCSFWVPQIIFNAFKGINRAFTPEFVIGISLCKFFFFIHYYGFSTFNLFVGNKKSNPLLITILFLYLAAQVALLLSMDRFGPRFFIPGKYRPKKYSYFRPLPDKDLEMNEEENCTICLSAVRSEPRGKVMVTPCNHSFHAECLSSWMEQKLKCPVCRSVLPSEID